MVHRDLKPENVLLEQGGRAMVTDFGLVKIVRDAGVQLTEASASSANRQHLTCGAGTPPYMAPEHWRSAEIDARTDLYAVGCMLFEAVTGHLAFSGSNLGELQANHTQGEVPQLRGSGLLVDGLNGVLQKCLAKDRGDRFGSAAELLRVLEGFYRQLFSEPALESATAGQFTAVDYSNRGKTYAELGRHEEALNDFNTALEIHPNLAMPYSNRGGIYQALGRHEDALADFTRPIEIDPSLAYAYSNRGNTYQAMGRHGEALANYTRAIEIEPNYAEAFNTTGRYKARPVKGRTSRIARESNRRRNSHAAPLAREHSVHPGSPQRRARDLLALPAPPARLRPPLPSHLLPARAA